MQFVWNTISQTQWPVWIAKEIGAFDKYNIDAELIFAEGTRAATSVISGTAQYGSFAGEGILLPVAEGADLVAIMSTGDRPTDMIVGGRDIDSPEDLRGQVVGTNTRFGETDLLMRYALEKMGLEPDSDVQVVVTGGESVRIGALAGDQVQATIVDAGLRQEMIDQGFHILFDFTGPEGDLKLIKNVIGTLGSTVDADPVATECVVKALLEAVAYWKTDKAGSVDIAAKYSGDMRRDALEILWDTYAESFPQVPTIPVEGFEILQEVLGVENPAVNEIDLESIIDNSFVETLDQNGFIDSLY
jgi:NitT/TauT family transport system substrate-binding protein